MVGKVFSRRLASWLCFGKGQRYRSVGAGGKRNSCFGNSPGDIFATYGGNIGRGGVMADEGGPLCSAIVSALDYAQILSLKIGRKLSLKIGRKWPVGAHTIHLTIKGTTAAVFGGCNLHSFCHSLRKRALTMPTLS